MPAGASEFAGDYACRVSSIRALLERLVAIESVNPTLVAGGAGEAEIGRFVAGWLAERGVDVELDTLLLNGHLRMSPKATASGGSTPRRA